MLSLENFTPSIYYQRSRDFQLLGRLFDLALNSTKTYADMIYTLYNVDYSGTALVELLASTLGFKQRHVYDIKQLINICSCLPSILRAKGTIKSIEITCNAILNAEGETNGYLITEPSAEDDNVKFSIIIPRLRNIALLYDVLTYILPAGCTLSIAEGGPLLTSKPTTEIEDAGEVVSNSRLTETEDSALMSEKGKEKPLTKAGLVSVKDRGTVVNLTGRIINGGNPSGT